MPTGMLVVLMFGLNAHAAVVALVDRGEVELNESFTLEVTIDTETNLAPDVSLLDQDFYVGQGSQLSNTTITNGQIRRSKTWTYVLMPKHTGQLQIPPINVGSERSDPLVIIVSEPSYSPLGEADVFVTSEIDFGETYVQAQVLYKIKIYRAVATRQPALRDPVISGAESLVELAGDDRSYEAVIDGKAYNVVERILALYPQESGEIQISPARFEARVLRDGRITGRKVYESEPQTITVQPIPAPPPEFPNAVWLPARDLQLTEDWSAETDELTAGQPVTRRVTVSALGQLETQIPALETPVVSGINVYPDKPDLSRQTESGGIRGVRQDQYAMIGVRPGNIKLPAMEVPWWNIAAGEWQVARLPERAIRILPSAELIDNRELFGVAMPADGVAAEPDQTATGQETVVPVYSDFWRYISEALAMLWLLTMAAWWWSSKTIRLPRGPREPKSIPVHKLQAQCLKAARKAALVDDADTVRAAMLEWGRLQWPDDVPRSVGAIATRVSSPLNDELVKLSRVSYGPAATTWSGSDFADAMRSFAILSDKENGDVRELLPPLMPPAA